MELQGISFSFDCQLLINAQLYILALIVSTEMEASRVEAKRISIRAQHRKEELQSIFANKRRIMLNRDLSSPQHFMHYYKLLQEGEPSIHDLREAANFLCQEHPFLSFDQSGVSPSKSVLQQHCYNLAAIVLSMASRHRTDQREDVDYRVACLTLLSNLLADTETNNEAILVPVCQFLKDIYFSLEMWGVDQETKEVGWLVGNLIGKQVVLHSNYKDISYILEWIEELIGVPEPEMLANIYRNLPKLVTSIQLKHGLPLAGLPECYKSNLINIIVKTIESNLSSNLTPRLLIKIVDFLCAYVYVSLAYCPKAMSEVVITKVMTLLGLMSFQCVKRAFRFLGLSVKALLEDLVPHERRILESMESIRIYIIENYSPKLIQLLAIRQAKVKREIFKFLHSLLESPSQHTIYFIANLVGTGLEDVLANLTKYDDNEIKHDCLHLVSLINRLSQGRYGAQFLEKYQGHQDSSQIAMSEGNQNPI